VGTSFIAVVGETYVVGQCSVQSGVYFIRL